MLDSINCFYVHCYLWKFNVDTFVSPVDGKRRKRESRSSLCLSGLLLIESTSLELGKIYRDMYKAT